MKKVKLICLPYAGGQTFIYNKWKEYVSENIEICPIELAGRGKRSQLPFYNNINEAIDDIYNIVRNIVINSDFALFGHSMGGLLVYELYYKILESCNRKASHIFISGKRPPHIQEIALGTHSLPDNEFLKIIKKLGGTNEMFFLNRDLVTYFLPILRADFKITELYEYTQKKSKINCPIIVLFGRQDKMCYTEMAQWVMYVNNKIDIYELDGDHFFIHNCEKNVINIINQVLAVNNL